MKNNKHIQSFNEHQENLNISGVMRSFTIEDMKKAFLAGCDVYYDDNDGRTTMSKYVTDNAFESFIKNYA